MYILFELRNKKNLQTSNFLNLLIPVATVYNFRNKKCHDNLVKNNYKELTKSKISNSKIPSFTRRCYTQPYFMNFIDFMRERNRYHVFMHEL